MKTLDIHNLSFSPLLFQLAARLELPALRKVLAPALRAAEKTSTQFQPELAPEPEKAADDVSRKEIAQIKRFGGAHSDAPRKTLFQIHAPKAKAVQLVADFTDWEKYPLDMIQCEHGNWFAIVPLEPGRYSYRFIVDGQWFNDPQSPQAPNPFGTSNAIVNIG